ncbi:MAG: chemotaxis protein CheW [Acidobacteriota bacterium]
MSLEQSHAARSAFTDDALQGASQFCTFFVADLYFGLDVRRVQEVLRSQEVTPVPKAPAVIAGLINLRGQIVPAIDMRRRLGLPARKPGVEPMNMVVRTEDGAASLLVDEIGDVLDVDAASFEPVPDNLAAEQRELIRGICKLRERLLLVLDAERTLELHGSAQAGGVP